MCDDIDWEWCLGVLFLVFERSNRYECCLGLFCSGFCKGLNLDSCFVGNGYFCESVINDFVEFFLFSEEVIYKL